MDFNYSWGVTVTVEFPLYDSAGKALTTGASFAAGDVKIIKDGGASGNTSNLPTHEGDGMYSLVLTATETQAGRISVAVNDQTATELWLSMGLVGTVDGDYQGAVWYDTGAANTGTVVGVNGIPSNPINAIADALTMAGTTNLRRIHILDGSVFTPASTATGIEFVGIGDQATCALNSQAYLFCKFVNVNVSGITIGDLFFADCSVSSLTSTSQLECWNCELLGTITLGGSGKFYDCQSINPAAGADAVFDLAQNNSDAVFRRFSGAIKLINMDATNNVDVEGTGDVEIDGTCVGGTVTIRGDMSYTDNSSGAVTIVTTAAGVNITQINGRTDVVATLERHLDIVEDVTITSGSTTTQLIAGGLTATTDDVYIDRVGIFVTGVAKGRGFFVTASNGTTDTLTVDLLPLGPGIGDRFLLLA